jgi:hypothetical protein
MIQMMINVLQVCFVIHQNIEIEQKNELFEYLFLGAAIIVIKVSIYYYFFLNLKFFFHFINLSLKTLHISKHSNPTFAKWGTILIQSMNVRSLY